MPPPHKKKSTNMIVTYSHIYVCPLFLSPSSTELTIFHSSKSKTTFNCDLEGFWVFLWQAPGWECQRSHEIGQEISACPWAQHQHCLHLLFSRQPDLCRGWIRVLFWERLGLSLCNQLSKQIPAAVVARQSENSIGLKRIKRILLKICIKGGM